MTVVDEIERTLLRRILRGEYPPGSYLPSVRQLAAEFGTTIPTIQRNVARLEAHRLIKAKQGSGLLVLDPQRNSNITLAAAWFDALWDQPARATEILEHMLSVREAMSIALVEMMPPPTADLAQAFSEAMNARGRVALRDADLRLTHAMLDHSGNLALRALFNTVEDLLTSVDGVEAAFYSDAPLHRRTLTAFLEHTIHRSDESRRQLKAALVEWNAAASGRFRAHRELALRKRRRGPSA